MAFAGCGKVRQKALYLKEPGGKKLCDKGPRVAAAEGQDGEDGTHVHFEGV